MPATTKASCSVNGSGWQHHQRTHLRGTNEGIEIEDKETPEDAFDRFIAGDLTLSNIKLVGGTDALDYDGSEVVDGDAQLDAYAAANGIEVSTMNVDYTFAF